MRFHLQRSRGVLLMLAFASASCTLATSAMATYGARGAVFSQICVAALKALHGEITAARQPIGHEYAAGSST